ncbi:MAG: tripartite tricarboxylate transporter substrate binding protein [Pseudomonas sp.]|uniref:tripartite tricarboxylate transporter substrate binding protein n=1 Tax=Pseudomonas sp. TaxID=306 RepID=UPI00120D3FDB|nr:tripartite tricarboxylate transporter substrate binding protein [Pseudomonas sp.]RZI75015.1 MAG: tripartite tricarboxylate transporter substrate binding protein [Pseudomonas sp.]
MATERTCNEPTAPEFRQEIDVVARTRRRLIQGLGVSACAWAWAWPASANDYPSKPIELIVPASAGGGTDALSRLFAEVAKNRLPQPFVVNNKPGASGAIGMSEVVSSRADGYKLCMIIAEVTTLPSLGLAKFDHTRFEPIARLNADPAAITVRADAPWNTLEEFLDAAKKQAGTTKLGNAGSGSVYHLSAIGLEDKVGVKFNHIPYSGAAPAVVALLGGHIDALDVSPAEVAPHVKGGKLKILGIMATERLAAFASVPTFKERHIDLALGTWRGLAAPKGAPGAVIDVLRTAARRVSEDPAFRNGLDKSNLGFAYLDAPEFAQAMQRDHEYFGQLIRKNGIKI